jgi:hypothetical protein
MYPAIHFTHSTTTLWSAFSTLDPQKSKKEVKTGSNDKMHKHEEGTGWGGIFYRLMYQAKRNGHGHDESVNA